MKAKVIGYSIPRQDLKSALVAFALQSGVSISTRSASLCAPYGRPLYGIFTPERALGIILGGTGCRYRRIDASAFEIVADERSPARISREKSDPSQPPPTAPTPDIDVSEVIVAATRRPTLAASLAYPVSLVDAHTLEVQNISDAGQLASIVPSVTVTNLGSGRDKILIRGLSDGPLTGRTQSTVGIYLDDSRITYNAPDPDLRLVDMSQVEVLRGPQGALYGSGSLGGIVHLVTNPPNSDARSGWVSASAGYTVGGAPSDTVEGMVNEPLASGRGAARLVLYREVDGGYIDNTILRLNDVNRTIREGLRLSALYRVSERWTLSAGIVGQDINSADTQYVLAGSPAFTKTNAVQEPHDNDFVEAHVDVHGSPDWGEAHATATFIRHHFSNRYDATLNPPVAGIAGPDAYDDKDEITGLVGEGTVSSPGGSRLSWLLGALVADTRQALESNLSILSTQTSVLTETRIDHLTEGALYGQARLPLGRGLSLTLGGRLFGTDTEIVSTVRAPISGGVRPYAAGLKTLGGAPKILLEYDGFHPLLVYAQAAEGYRPGGVNTTGPVDQVFSASGGVAPNWRYQGDELWDFESGVRFHVLGDHLTGRAALFGYVWKNIQSDELLPSGIPYTGNIGDGRDIGLEGEAGWRAGPLRLGASVLLNSPEIDNPSSSFPARTELAFAGVPRLSGNLAVDYSWALPRNMSVELDGRVAYVGPSKLTFDATISPTMGEYVNGRLAATLAAPRWRLTLSIDNPANVSGNTFAYGNPFALRSTQQITPLRPTTVSLTVRAIL